MNTVGNKKHSIYGMLLLIFTLFSGSVLGQAKSDSVLVLTDLETQLPDLEEIVSIAVQRSPYIKVEDANVKARGQAIHIVKKDWQKDIQAFGNYAYGDQKFAISYGDYDRQTNFLNGYRVGVNVSIPLFDITARHNRIKLSKAELEMARGNRERVEQELKRQIAAEYNNLLAAQKLLKIRSEGLQSAQLVYQMAEKQFKEGTIYLEDYSSVSNMLFMAESNYEIARKDYNTVYKQFEYLIGVSISSLIKQK
jgi:outer membrane protein TolC